MPEMQGPIKLDSIHTSLYVGTYEMNRLDSCRDQWRIYWLSWKSSLTIPISCQPGDCRLCSLFKKMKKIDVSLWIFFQFWFISLPLPHISTHISNFQQNIPARSFEKNPVHSNNLLLQAFLPCAQQCKMKVSEFSGLCQNYSLYIEKSRIWCISRTYIPLKSLLWELITSLLLLSCST